MPLRKSHDRFQLYVFMHFAWFIKVEPKIFSYFSCLFFWLLIAFISFIDNLKQAGFLEYPNRNPNWVPQLIPSVFNWPLTEYWLMTRATTQKTHHLQCKRFLSLTYLFHPSNVRLILYRGTIRLLWSVRELELQILAFQNFYVTFCAKKLCRPTDFQLQIPNRG